MNAFQAVVTKGAQEEDKYLGLAREKIEIALPEILKFMNGNSGKRVGSKIGTIPGFLLIS